MMKELILATSNAGKIAELQALLTPIQCIPQQTLNIPDADEIGLSFIENAIIKARHASMLGGKPALADDSGLVVPALNGEPGIYSARYSGEHATSHSNMQRLLEKLSNVPDDERYAYFYCAIVVVKYSDDPTPFVATGKLNGIVAKDLKGNKGFGYDPIIYLPDYDARVAELSPAIKNKISHRAIALNALLTQMKA